MGEGEFPPQAIGPEHVASIGQKGWTSFGVLG